jgi:hypothetical protein
MTISKGLEIKFELQKERKSENIELYVIVNDDETLVELTELSEAASWDWDGEKRSAVYSFLEEKKVKDNKLPEIVGKLIKEKLKSIKHQIDNEGAHAFYEAL